MVAWPISIVLVLGGGFLLLAGLRGRRRGRQRVCVGCGYDVRGLESPRCPECGLLLNENGVAIGVRGRSPVLVCLGGLLLVAGGLLGYVKAYSVDPYPHLPFVWLLPSADGGNAQAFAEISRRLKAAQLKPAQLDRLAGLCLDIQADESRADAQQWIDLLEYMDTTIALSEEDRQRYYEQATTGIQVEIPSVAYVGQRLYIQVEVRTRLPTRGFSHQPFRNEVRIDGIIVRSYWRFSREVGQQRTRGYIWQVLVDDPGEYKIDYSGKLVLFRNSAIVWSKELLESKLIELKDAPTLAEDPRATIEPELRRRILSKLQISISVGGYSEMGDPEHLQYFGPSLALVEPLPVALASDVFARVRETEYRIGTLTCEKGSMMLEFTAGPLGRDSGLLSFPETDAHVVLKPNISLLFPGEGSVPIWGEELVLGPIKLGRIERE